MNFLIGILIAYLIITAITDEKLVNGKRRRRRRRYDVDSWRERDAEERDLYEYLRDRYEK